MPVSIDDLDLLHAETDDLLVRHAVPGADADVRVEADVSGLDELAAAFVAAFDGHDVDGVLEVVADDVEMPDRDDEGAAALTDELVRLWNRLPDVVLTRGWDDGAACAVAWRPDEDQRWVRCGLVLFEASDDLLTCIRLIDDAQALDAVVADEPVAWRRPELVHPDHDDD